VSNISHLGYSDRGGEDTLQTMRFGLLLFFAFVRIQARALERRKSGDTHTTLLQVLWRSLLLFLVCSIPDQPSP
jgi:hypothetical protein